MRAWQVHEHGEPRDVLRLETVPEPEPRPDQVRVTVEAVALNFPDVLLCRGQYQERPALPFTPGLEVVGRVTAAGADSGRRVGDRVVGTTGLPHGGLAEETLLDAGDAYDLPEEVPAVDAACFFLTYHTGYVGLHERARLAPGETLLVHAGAGGVGSAAIQLGRAAGARVVATAGGPRKVEVCRRLGADVAVDYLADDFVAVVKEVTGGRGADVVYDPVGGDVFDRSTRCTAFEGRLVVVGFTGGRIAEARTNHLLVKNYSVVGLHWGLYRRLRPRVVAETHEALLVLHARGAVRPLVEAVLPLEEAPSGLERLAARGTVGKVVVTPGA